MPHHDPLELYTIAQVVELSKQSRRTITRLIKVGRSDDPAIAARGIRSVKLGRSTRIPRTELERYLAGDEPGYDDTENPDH